MIFEALQSELFAELVLKILRIPEFNLAMLHEIIFKMFGICVLAIGRIHIC